MKLKLVLLFFTVLFFSGCREDKMEVLNDVYISKPDTPAKIKSKVEGTFQNVSAENYESGKIIEAEAFINENGKIDMINLKDAMKDGVKHTILNTMKNLEFEPAVLNGEKVKSQTVLAVQLNKDRKEFTWKIKVKDDNMDFETPAWLKEDEFQLSADKMPEPVGGMQAILKNVRYPEIARRAGIEGKVFVAAYIDEKGDVVHTSIIQLDISGSNKPAKGVGQNAGLDEAAMEAIKLTKFTPAIKNNVPVKSKVTIPMLFKLN